MGSTENWQHNLCCIRWLAIKISISTRMNTSRKGGTHITYAYIKAHHRLKRTLAMQVTRSTAPQVARLVTHIETNTGIYIRATAASNDNQKKVETVEKVTQTIQATASKPSTFFSLLSFSTIVIFLHQSECFYASTHPTTFWNWTNHTN